HEWRQSVDLSRAPKRQPRQSPQHASFWPATGGDHGSSARRRRRLLAKGYATTCDAIMSGKLILRDDGVDHQSALEPTDAPKTLAKVIAALPVIVDVHCAKIAGSHIMWPVPFVERAEKASDVLAMAPGAFFFWPERQYLEITYDALQAET